MESAIIGMLAETFVHPGSGQAMSAIDLPVARERTTDYPFIPGSGVKGGFRAWAEEVAGIDAAERKRLFGEAEGAGTLLFSDARLLLLPVRSLNAAYVWLTCPLLIERLKRDVERMGGATGFGIPVSVGKGKYLGHDFGLLTLEDREFSWQAGLPHGLSAAIATLLPRELAARVSSQTAIVTDEAFGWFARNGLPVNARNELKDNKTSNNLWYEETLPPDTVMHCLVAGRKANELSQLTAKLAIHKYCQLGGNETLGQGWFHLTRAQFAEQPKRG